MIYEIVITEKAEEDLREIYEYIAYELMESEYAKRQIVRIEEKIVQLEEFPEKFRLYEEEPWNSENMRITFVDNYSIFYTPNKEKHEVVINRIMYSGRNYSEQLGAESDN